MPVQPDTYQFIPATVFPGGAAMNESGDLGFAASPEDALQWIRDGKTRGLIVTGKTNGVERHTTLIATGDSFDGIPGPHETNIMLASDLQTAVPHPELSRIDLDIQHPSIPNGGPISGHTRNKLLLDGLGASGFLQLLLDAQLELALGTTNVVFPGGSPDTANVVRNHNLQRPPVVYGAFANAGITGGKRCIAIAYGASATQLNIIGKCHDDTNPAAGETVPVSWFAIG